MKKILFSLMVVFVCKVNAQNTHRDLVTDNVTIITTNTTTSQPKVVLNTSISKSSSGYLWGPMNFQSDSIVRMGKDFSTITFCVKELPRRPHDMA